MNDCTYTIIDSPVGELLLAGQGDVLHRLSFMRGRRPAVAATLGGFKPDDIRPARSSEAGCLAGWRRTDDAFPVVREQLSDYFDGRRREFDVPLSLAGNEFERRVWDQLLTIPYGETISYGEIARTLGSPGAARAVGLANRRNPVAVIV